MTKKLFKKTIIHLCALMLLTCLSGLLHAQATATKDYATKPYWIDMMKDTNTNYFEAVKAFNTYWNTREKPEDENERFANAGKEDHSKNVPYSFEYKKFQHWQMQVKPYVQNDGSILYPHQQLQISRNSRKATPSTTTK